MVPRIPTPTPLSGFVLLLPLCFLGFSIFFWSSSKVGIFRLFLGYLFCSSRVCLLNLWDFFVLLFLDYFFVEEDAQGSMLQ